MTEQHLILERHLSQLEVDKAGIEHAINEIQRRFALLDEVEAWGLLVDEVEPWGLLVKEESSPDYHPGDSRYDSNQNQENYGNIEEAVSSVPAGFF